MSTANIHGVHDHPITTSLPFTQRLVYRFLWAALGGWLAMGLYVYFSWGGENLVRQRWLNVAAIGVLFGICVGILVLLTAELPAQLRQHLPPIVCFIGGVVCGSVWGTLTWAAYHWFVLYEEQLAWAALVVGGAGLAVGFSILNLVSLPSWIAIILTSAAIYLPILVTAQGTLFGYIITPLLSFRQTSHVFTLGIPMALLVALGGMLPMLRHRRKFATSS